MKSLQEWLDEYAESHTHPTNIIIHKICVPLIQLSLFMMLWKVPFLTTLFTYTVPDFLSNAAHLTALLALIFYARLSIKIALGIFLQFLVMVLVILGLQSIFQVNLLLLGQMIFIVAWIMQFIGHKIEGKKPSFFKDLQFLLIGPLWVIVPLYRRFKIPY